MGLLSKKKTIHEVINDKVVLQVSVPLNNEQQANAVVQFYQSLHGVLRGKERSIDHFSLEIVGNSGGIFFVIVCNARYHKFIENQIYASYPDAQVIRIQDYTDQLDKSSASVTAIELSLRRDYYLPIRTYDRFEVDPIAAITSTMAKLAPGQDIWIQIVIRPIDNSWQEKGKNYIASISKTVTGEGKTVKADLETEQREEIRQIERKSTLPGFQFVMRVITRAPDSLTSVQLLEDLEAALKQFDAVQLNGMARSVKKRSFWRKLFPKEFDKFDIARKFQMRLLEEDELGIFNTQEIASLYHLPHKSVQTPNIAWARTRKLEVPQNLPVQTSQSVNTPNNLPLQSGDFLHQGVRFFGLTDYRNVHIPFGIKREDRRRHMYLLGKTGTGKSLFIKNMVWGDIYENEGFAVIDPHGDLVEEIMEFIPEHRMKDVVYLDPSDTEFPIGLNMLDAKEGESKELLADGIVSVFIRLFGHSWGPRLQHILHNTILTLLHCQGVSLLAVQRILLDANYRKFLLKQIDDPFILKFWNEEYSEMSKNPKLLAETLSPIHNKVGRFLSSPMVRNMIGQVKSSIDLQDIMDSGKILLVNLSQGKIGEENTSLLGGMLVTRLYTNAMQRAHLPVDQRRDFYLYVDEFQNFATNTFVKILSESRKYGLNLLVTHQYIDQIEPPIQDAIFGNIGTLINYVVGPKDAARLEREYRPYLEADDLVNMAKFSFVIKLMVDGAQSNPFTGKLILPNYGSTGLKEQVKHASRTTYASRRDEVEQKLNKWARQEYDSKGNLVQSK